MKVHRSLKTVTPLSKTLAFALFIILPFIGFFIGMEYGKMHAYSQQEQQSIFMPYIPTTDDVQKPASPTGQIGLPNPAAVYCGQQGGISKIVTAKNGSQSGSCTINGKTCDEWKYFRTKTCN